MRFIGGCIWVLFVLGCQSTALTSAKLYLREGEDQKAKQELEKALQGAPQNPEIHFLLGEIAATEGDYAGMVSALGTVLELDPEWGEKVGQLRRQYWVEEYNKGVSLADSSSPDYAGALQAFDHATLIDPEALESWRNKAYVHYRLDSLDAAIGAYEKVAAAAPSDTGVCASLGSLYLRQQRYEDATRMLVHLVELDPADSEARVNLGVAYEQLERFAEAEAAYREAIRLDPGYALAHHNLGHFYWGRENYPAASEAYAKTVELNPEDGDALYNLAATYLKMEEMDRALPLLQELSERMPDNASVWWELGRIYAHKGMVEESQKAYDRYEVLNP